jgi:hypothetical protein
MVISPTVAKEYFPVGACRQNEIRPIFEKEPFGALEHFVTQKLFDVAERERQGGIGSI